MTEAPRSYIFCVLWEGEFRQRNYTVNDVLRLKRQVEKHMPSHINYEFFCFVNKLRTQPCGFIQIPLHYNLPGWWSKLEIFRGNIPLPKNSHCLYLDLDLLITGDLEPLIHNENVTDNRTVTFAPPGIMTTTSIQSSVIHWRLHNFNIDLSGVDTKRLQQKYRGDQDFLDDVLKKNKATFPEQWFCKLRDCWNEGPRPLVKVVLGNPKPLWWKREEREWICKLMSV